ncbi:hypothetical protein ES288_D13G196700v1 [Gossypium darwinii]|uniref:Uncharacterized protein n=1 Tax=Gossypium darwinii TaxID=34276 RepID=A0A5D2A2F8_GOSDA|nr:hypothetical protein ES288_D13G196700v1 [Gossypium darwinii]
MVISKTHVRLGYFKKSLEELKQHSQFLLYLDLPLNVANRGGLNTNNYSKRNLKKKIELPNLIIKTNKNIQKKRKREEKVNSPVVEKRNKEPAEGKGTKNRQRAKEQRTGRGQRNKEPTEGKGTKNQYRARNKEPTIREEKRTSVRVAKKVKEPAQKHFLAEKLKNSTFSSAQKHFK